MTINRLAFFGGIKGFTFAPVITGTVFNYNLRSAAVSAGWDQVEPLFCVVTLAASSSAVSNTAATPSFTASGTYPANSTLEVVIPASGSILGAFGNGGAGGVATGTSANNGSPGGAGGTAFITNYSIKITNAGTIAGGGGGGGGGGGVFRENTGFGVAFASGGAGGSGAGAGAAAQPGVGGGFSNPVGGHTATGGSGGNGGSLGVAGVSGDTGSSTGGTGGGSGVGNVGGSPGNAIVGNAFITWVQTGTRLGPIT